MTSNAPKSNNFVGG
jgi:hypothetical protein